VERRTISALALTLLIAAPRATHAAVAIQDSTAESCAVRIRAATFEDTLQRERNPLLGAPRDLNNAPGPGALRAVVRHQRPSIFVVDTLAGTERYLCGGSMPRFSPDGRWIACDRWRSHEHPYVLGIADARTGTVHDFERVGQIEEYAWSPDSRRLAYASYSNIGWIDVASGTVHVLANDPAPHGADWSDLEWAPDSRRFLGRRHLEYEHDDNVYATDLWLFDVKGQTCRLTNTPKVDEDSPGWIDDRHIRYESSEDSDDPVLQGRRYVVELASRGRRP